MSGFHRQRLRQLRKAAGLHPMPAFLRSYGERLPLDKDGDYIDSRYFSPEARRWMREASRFRAQGGTLTVEDEECSDRVLTALMGANRKPTPAQEAKFKRKQLLRYCDRIMPILLEREMRRRGYHYGPDYELPDDLPLPSPRELLFRHMATEFGAPSVGAAKAAFYRWRKAAGTH